MIKKSVKRSIASLTLVAFMAMSVLSSYAQNVVLPAPGTMVALSEAYAPPLLKGIKVYPDNPFRLDFILDKGSSSDPAVKLKDESSRLIKYFLASVTVPEKDLWVNLSPYEKDRIVPDAFGVTEMGRDLLAQDYMLKQITASVIYPEGEVGKAFWAKVYAEAQRRYGTSDVPVDTFNKVWIVPEKATVYENKDAAFVVESKLKVMLESDYVAATQNMEMVRSGSVTRPPEPDPQELGKQILREVVIPILEKEVNEGRNFAQLRQVYQSLILAVWYKDKVRESIFGNAYVDRNKTGGVDIADKTAKDKIWTQYVEAFKKGAYNYIKEDLDPETQQKVPRKYFSGGVGFDGGKVRAAMARADRSQLSDGVAQRAMIVRASLDASMTKDEAGLARSQVDAAGLTGRDALEKVYDVLDHGHVFRVPQRVISSLFGHGTNAGFVHFEGAAVTREDMARKLRNDGLDEALIGRILQDGVILVLDDLGASGQSVVAHEFFHRLYISLSENIRKDLNWAWDSLPAQWKQQVVKDLWKDRYQPEQYPDEFWAYFLKESLSIKTFGLPVPDTMHVLMATPGVAYVLKNYDLLNVHFKHVERISITELSAERPMPVAGSPGRVSAPEEAGNISARIRQAAFVFKRESNVFGKPVTDRDYKENELISRAREIVVARLGPGADRDFRYVVLNERYFGVNAMDFVNTDARTIVCLGPKYDNHDAVLSNGPVILLEAKPMDDIVSNAWVHLEPGSAPKNLLFARDGISAREADSLKEAYVVDKPLDQVDVLTQRKVVNLVARLDDVAKSAAGTRPAAFERMHPVQEPKQLLSGMKRLFSKAWNLVAGRDEVSGFSDDRDRPVPHERALIRGSQISFSELKRRLPQAEEQVTVALAQHYNVERKTPNDFQYVLLNENYGGAEALEFINQDANTVVVLGPLYFNHYSVDSQGPVIMIGARSVGNIRSEAWVHVGPLSVPKARVYGRLGVSIHERALMSYAKVESSFEATHAPFMAGERFTDTPALGAAPGLSLGAGDGSMEKADNTGGIDLTRDKIRLQVQGKVQGVGFMFDPAMIRQLQNAPGLTPVIIDIQPMTTTVPMFLGLKDDVAVQGS